jgi:hypothetical protein
MKKNCIIIAFFLTILLLNLVFALTTEQNKDIRDCKKKILLDKKTDYDNLNSDYNTCLISCKSLEKTYRQDCRSSCFETKNINREIIKFMYQNYDKNCRKTILAPDSKCEEGKYNVGAIFLDGCKICRCNFDDEIYCMTTPYCNFKDINIKEDECIENNGLYQKLCNGPYFDLVCSKNKFCLCEGAGNYACPEDYICIKEFRLTLNRRDNTIPGWKTHLGKDLGDVGICAKKIAMDRCGDGVCDNLMNSFNDAPENNFNCPEDCQN